ncbi:unnamed protein product, partial [Medioppia subpectinata]
DGNGNRVKQWTGLTPIRGVVSQELQLSEQPVLGDWAIVVELSGVKHQKAFSVAEYVLPTFDVEVVLPKYTTRDRPDIVATVKALYTYGQGVKGDLTLTVQTKEHYSRSKYRTRYPIDGSVDIPINLMDDLSLDQHFQNMEIEVIGVVKEALTGRSYNRSNTMKIYDRDVKVEQVKTSQTFKPGLKYPVLIKVTDQDDKPVPENGPKLTLKYGYTYEDRDQKTVLMSPVNGLIAVDLYPPNNTEHINLRAEYMGKDYWLENIQKAQSPSGNYIQVVRLDSDKDVSVGQLLRFAVNATEPIGRLVCEVLGKGDIVWAQSIDIPDNKMTHEFTLEATQAMVPTARLVCHYLRAANQEVVADGLKFDVSGTLRTPVSVTTDVQTTKPGAPVEVRVSTKPDAYVGLLGVDQSVLLLKSGYDITREDVDKELKTYDSTGADDQHRYGWWQNSVTAGEIFDNSGVVVMSNGLIHRQRAYGDISGESGISGMIANLRAMALAMGEEVGSQSAQLDTIVPRARCNTPYKRLSSPPDTPQPVKVRLNFPQTWIWSSGVSLHGCDVRGTGIYFHACFGIGKGNTTRGSPEPNCPIRRSEIVMYRDRSDDSAMERSRDIPVEASNDLTLPSDTINSVRVRKNFPETWIWSSDVSMVMSFGSAAPLAMFSMAESLPMAKSVAIPDPNASPEPKEVLVAVDPNQGSQWEAWLSTALLALTKYPQYDRKPPLQSNKMPIKLGNIFPKP